jgi:uncharacterized protein (TIGR03118 family)
MPQATNIYLQHNLVADQAGLADFTDPGLVNPWGIAITGTSPFWLSDAASGLSTVYTSSGKPSTTIVTIPPGAKGTAPGKPTGIVAPGSAAFPLATGKNASFIFATLDGTISGWASSVNPTQAVIKVDNSGSAVYTGLAVGGTTAAPMLYAANFNSGKIEVFDVNFAPVTLANAFADPGIPAGFAPYNIQNLGGSLYVTYAMQDAYKQVSVPGPGNGYVDIYDMNGVLLQHLVSGGPLNAPWGVAIAPANFGPFSNDLLVGNFGDGRINAFDPKTGALVGTVQDSAGNAIRISGLWGLQPGNGHNGGDTNAVYFTAGTSGETHGLFGSLQAAPVLTTSSIVNGASFQTALAQNTWITLGGSNLAATTRAWTAADIVNGKLPATLDGVGVMVDGKPAYVAYVSPTQVNALSPVDATQGPVQVSLSNNGLSSGNISAQLQAYAPAFFMFNNGKYVAAVHSDNVTPVGPTTLFPNLSTPAKPGDTVVIYGTGMGPAMPSTPDGVTFPAPLQLTATPTVQIGGNTAQVVSAVLTSPGLYQLNVVVPASTADGDAAVTVAVGGVTSPGGAFIAVQH